MNTARVVIMALSFATAALAQAPAAPVHGFRLHLSDPAAQPVRIGMNDGVEARWSQRGWRGPLKVLVTAAPEGAVQAKVFVGTGSAKREVKTATLRRGEELSLVPGKDVEVGYFGPGTNPVRFEYIGPVNTNQP
jgi:hypothetical protein